MIERLERGLDDKLRKSYEEYQRGKTKRTLKGILIVTTKLIKPSTCPLNVLHKRRFLYVLPYLIE